MQKLHRVRMLGAMCLLCRKWLIFVHLCGWWRLLSRSVFAYHGTVCQRDYLLTSRWQMTSQWLMLSWCTDNLESRMTVPCSWNNERSITPCRLIKRLLRLKTWGKRDYIEAVIETAIILMIEYDCDHTLFKKSHESVKVWIPKAARRLFCSMNALMIRTNNIRKFLESGRPQSLHSGLLIDDNTTEKECNLRPAVLSTAPAIRLTWKEIDLKTYRAMKTEERGAW